MTKLVQHFSFLNFLNFFNKIFCVIVVFLLLKGGKFEMKKKYTHLTYEDRVLIQACINDNQTITEIAKNVHCNKSTISRELSKHAFIRKVSEIGLTFATCPYLGRAGFCNNCPKNGSCRRDRRYYNYNEAENNSSALLRNCRSKPKISEENIQYINEVVTLGVRQGQSLHHIYVADSSLKKICCEKTIRRLVYRGNLDVKAHELRRFVRYKHHLPKVNKDVELKDIRVLIGRSYKDFCSYTEKHKRKNVVEYDSVIGKRNDNKAILTVTFKKYNFQFGLLIAKGKPSSVSYQIRKMFKKIGSDLVKEIFPINLSDNGTEFSYFTEIEIDENGEKICNTYFARPNRADDKTHCERNHELVRYIFPKGKSLNNVTQKMVDEAFSNINSYVRESLGDKTPYELVEKRFGKQFLDKINIHKIPKKKVRLVSII